MQGQADRGRSRASFLRHHAGLREDCVVLYAGDGSWNDQQCALARAFICEGAIGP